MEDVSRNSSSLQSQSFLILSNIGKRGNFGTLLRYKLIRSTHDVQCRSAAAFGVKEVFVVGEKKIKTFGNQGTVNHLKLSFYNDFDSLRTYLKNKKIIVCGIEITDHAISIDERPFKGSTAFMLGNEGTGMTQKQIDFCDQFCYIKQFSGNLHDSRATASLNVAVAGSIALHHFAEWTGFIEIPKTGFKFQVEQPSTRLDIYLNPSTEELKNREALRQLRQTKKDNDDSIESPSFLF